MPLCSHNALTIYVYVIINIFSTLNVANINVFPQIILFHLCNNPIGKALYCTKIILRHSDN